jgi:CheY-like chemotaxis protein
LVVEDDDLNLNLFTAIVELEGWTVLKARSQQEAFLKLAGQPRPLNLLVTEIGLRDGDGLEVAQYALTRNPKTVCVFIADYQIEYIREEYPAHKLIVLESQRAKLLLKPFTAIALRQAVRQLTTCSVGHAAA